MILTLFEILFDLLFKVKVSSLVCCFLVGIVSSTARNHLRLNYFLILNSLWRFEPRLSRVGVKTNKLYRYIPLSLRRALFLMISWLHCIGLIFGVFSYFFESLYSLISIISDTTEKSFFQFIQWFFEELRIPVFCFFSWREAIVVVSSTIASLLAL